MDALPGRAGFCFFCESRKPAAPDARVAPCPAGEFAADCAPPPRPLAPDPTQRFQSPAAGEGSEIAISFRPVPGLPLRVGWLAQITEFAWNSHFCDEQIRGPFASWKHRHSIVAESREDGSNGSVNGTLITDEVEYRLPLGALGKIADTAFVKGQMDAMFAYRQQKLEEILPVAARQAARKS